MKVLIIYDSVFGNTEKIALAMRQCFGPQDSVEVLQIGAVTLQHLTGLDLLIVGSPTRGFRPTPAITRFLNSISTNALNNLKVAAFDTRISIKDIKSPFLSFMANLFGYAADPIARQLKKKGGQLLTAPEGFFVKDSQGPLKEGEIERVAIWLQTFK